MNRANYCDEPDDMWALIRYRGAVKSAIRGKRGQAFLHELQSALLALSLKELIANDFCEIDIHHSEGRVCALGSVAVKREVEKGKDVHAALEEVQKTYNPINHKGIAEKLGIADALAREIMFENDERGLSPSDRYRSVLAWVEKNLIAPGRI